MRRDLSRSPDPSGSGGFSGSRRNILIAVGLVVVVAAAGLPLVRALHQRRLVALFDGPCQEQNETRSGFYPGLVYDLTDYLSDTDNEARTDRTNPLDQPWGTTRLAHPADNIDAASGATRVVRLKSPSVYKAAWIPRALTVTYPPDNAVFPPNLCAPFIEWGDAHNDFWEVILTVPAKKGDSPLFSWTALSTSRRWRVPDDVWGHIKELATGVSVTLRVKGVKRSGLWGRTSEGVHVSKVVRFTISTDRCDNAVVYRLIDPPFVSRKTPNMYARDIREKEPRLFLNARRQFCFNCHAFSSKSGNHGKLGLQVRYIGRESVEHPIYLSVYDIDTRRGRKVVVPFDLQMSTVMSWSPDGTRLAFSANHKITPADPLVFETQSIGQPSADIGIYDPAAGTMWLLPGACDPDMIELYPTWTPDGSRVVFSSVEKGKRPQITRFNLTVIPYNEGRGGKAEPVLGASNNGKSNFFAHFSPDGRWMTFVQSTYGSLIKACSDIYIMPADLKTPPRPLESNTPYAADSWHSWSTNSRWLVFASKRDDGIFARLYFTHIDENGHASPAVRLPIEDPDIRMSFNIPEFTADVPTIEEERLMSELGLGAEVQNAVNIEDHESEHR